MIIGDGIAKIIASRKGYDIRSCLEKFLTLDSRRNILKLKLAQSITLTVPN